MSCDIATSRSTKIGTQPSLTGTCAKGAVAKALGGRTPVRAHINRAVSDRQPNAVVTSGTSLWTCASSPSQAPARHTRWATPLRFRDLTNGPSPCLLYTSDAADEEDSV